MTHSLHDLGLLALGTRCRLLSEQITVTVKAFYEEKGLVFEPRWFPLFRVVRRQPDIGMMQLARQLGVSHAAVNGFCKQLTEAGLITLTGDADDGRVKRVRLSDEGEVMYARLEPAWFVLEKALDQVFPGEDAQRILAVLDRLDEALADQAIPRALKSVLRSDTLRDQLTIAPYDPADPEHKRYFAALNIEWLERYFTVEPVDWRMFADPKATILDPGGSIFLALIERQIVGVCAVIKRDGGIHELAKMAVSTLFQGKGVGTALVEVVLDHCRSQGLETLYLVSSTQLPHAVPTYRKLGFVDSPLPLHEAYARSDITLEMRLG